VGLSAGNPPTDGYATATRRPGLSAPAAHEVRLVDSLRGGNAEQISRACADVRERRCSYATRTAVVVHVLDLLKAAARPAEVRLKATAIRLR
jgi:hypothetical protein